MRSQLILNLQKSMTCEMRNAKPIAPVPAELLVRNAKCEIKSYHYPEKLNCAKCEMRKGNQHMPGNLVCAKCEMRRWERLKFEKMVCAKCENIVEELDISLRETGHLSCDWTFL